MRAFWIFSVFSLLLGCSEAFLPSEGPELEPLDLQEVPDFESPQDGLAATFDRHLVLSDLFFEDTNSMNAEGIQNFFENTPYGTRSWLASASFEGKRAADLIMEASLEFGINPMLLLLRLQVEQGLVSKTVRPSASRVEKALGCGCPDNRPCMAQFRGFRNQMRCGAETHRKLFDQSKDGGAWSAGKAKRTLDPLSVTPRNHATAALYAYTPWVLQNRGGNWLVWNIGRRYLQHLERTGTYSPPVVPWVGSACTIDADCRFTSGSQTGFCFEFQDFEGERQGFCTLGCAGGCPDRSGEATTFCVELEVGLGRCVSKAEELNDFCTDIPGTRVEELDRFVGSSNATQTRSSVCSPDL